MEERGHLEVTPTGHEGPGEPQVAERGGLERTPERRLDTWATQAQLQPPDLRGQLLLGIEIDEHGAVDLAEEQPDHRILGGRLGNAAVPIHRPGDRAVHQSPATAAAGIPARLGRVVRIIEMSDEVVHRGHISAEASGKMQPWAVQIGHGDPPPLTIGPRSTARISITSPGR